MRIILIIFFSCLSLIIYGQKKSKKKKETNIYSVSFNAYYGHRYFLKDFSNQLSTLSNLDFNKPSNFVGVGILFDSYMINPRHSLGGQFYYNYFIPKNIVINDTVNAQFKGFSVNVGYGKTFWENSKHFNLSVFLGFNTGNLKLICTDKFSQIKPFFSPKISMQPKFIIKRFTLSVNLDFDYDLINEKWKKDFMDSSGFVNTAIFPNSGFNCAVGIGYYLY